MIMRFTQKTPKHIEMSQRHNTCHLLLPLSTSMPEELQELLKKPYVYESTLISLWDELGITSVDIANFKKVYKGIIKDTHKDPTNPIEQYLNALPPQMSEEETLAMMSRYRRWDHKAFEKLIACNIAYVVYRAKSFIWRWLQFLDLVGEWVLGLKKAIDLYDETKWAKLTTYAAFRIDQAIHKSISEYKNSVRLPVHVSDDSFKIHKAQQEFFQKNDRYMTDAEVLNDVDISSKSLNAISNVSRSVSLDSNIWDEENSTTIWDFLKDNQSDPAYIASTNIQHECLIETINTSLSEQEAGMIKMKFWLWWFPKVTLECICKEFWITRERTRQIIERSLVKLRTSSQLAERFCEQDIVWNDSKVYGVRVSSTWLVKDSKVYQCKEWSFIMIKNVKVYMHDIVAETFCWYKPNNRRHKIYHINKNIFDNRMENLYISKW